jgi:twinkle protein
MGGFIRHLPCEACGSSDANALYDSGSTYCFRCKTYDGLYKNEDKNEMSGLLTDIKFSAKTKRKLSEETCRRFGYGSSRLDGNPVEVAPYYVDGQIVAQKIRDADKNFSLLGNARNLPFFGQQLWPTSGKRITITEGELDAMSIYEVESHGKYGAWPVVSVPNGASGAAKTFKQELEWLCGFDKVIICFDQDGPGVKAANECAALLPPGKAFIAVLPRKDASDCLVEGLTRDLEQALWNAQAWRPDGILTADDALSEIANRDLVTPIATYPFTGLNDMTLGIRSRELVTVCGGSGIGKSEFVRNIAANALIQGCKIGYLALEESVPRTALGLLGLFAKRPLYQEAAPLEIEGMRDLWDAWIKDKAYFFNHFGSTDPQNLLARIRYMAVGLGCNLIILDHISIVVSGIADGDERRTIDNLVTNLRSLVEETGVGIVALSHLKRASEGEYHEEGGKTSLAQLRGSGAIGQLSDIVIGLERNQQSDTDRDVLSIRVLKNRWNGVTGLAGKARYDRESTILLDESASEKFEEIK